MIASFSHRVRVALALALAASAIACGNPATTPATTPGNTGGDAQIGDAQGQDSDSGVQADTVGQDVPADTLPVDVLAGGDATPTTDVTTADADAGDAQDATDAQDGTSDAKLDTTDTKTDTGTDIAQDADTDTTKPEWKCTLDADCPAGFSDCMKAACDVTTGKCDLKLAPDATPCKVNGLCGGTGACQKGGCTITSPCAASPCTPTPIKCGDKVVVDLAKLGPSGFATYLCAALPWDGAEKAFLLAGDVTGTATVTLADDPLGTRLLLRHDLADAVARDHFVQGWRFQLAVLANTVSDEVNAGAAARADQWFEAWNEVDAGRRRAALVECCVEHVAFADRYSNTHDLDDLEAHVAASKVHMPGVTLARASEPRHCQGAALVDWLVTAADGKPMARGTNLFEFAPDGRIARVVGFWG